MRTGMARVAVAAVSSVLSALPSSPEAWMSPSELARAARLRAPQRHQHYLAGHWLARLQLAQWLGGEPMHYTLIERDNLPPLIADQPLRLSLSHSGDWIACAISSAPIGIDLEQLGRGAQLRRFAHLLPAEGESEDELDDDHLLQRWVLKEAVIKRDCGMALPQQLMAVRLRACTEADARISLLSTSPFHLAIASAEPWTLDSPEDISQHQYWCESG